MGVSSKNRAEGEKARAEIRKSQSVDTLSEAVPGAQVESEETAE